MSKLLDAVVHTNYNSHHRIGDTWYIAKPIPMKSIKNIISNFKDAIRVLRGKSFAVHYKIDE